MKILGEAPLSDIYDVVVVGSGAGGLVAALTAAINGQSVLVLEKSSQIGGTSAVSAGTIWVPANAQMLEAGIEDSLERAREYLGATVGTGDVIDAFLANANPMISFLQDHSPIELTASLTYPDYKLGLPGSCYGRAMQPHIYDTRRLGPLKDILRRDVNLLQYSMIEFKKWGSWANFPWNELRDRTAKGIVARGAALVGPIFEACLEAGVDFAVEAPVGDLTETGQKVDGVVVAGKHYAARNGVILACGGFEWNPAMMAEFLPMPISVRCSPPHNTGDGHRMAMRLGARMDSMDQAWWAPMVAMPGQQVDGEQVGRHIRSERQSPGVVIVDGTGKRIVNEAQDYNSLIRSALATAQRAGTPLRMFVIFDHHFLERFGFLTRKAGDPMPEGVAIGTTPADVAAVLNIDPHALTATIERFNRFAVSGVDEDFARGDSLYDRYGGDPDNPYPNGNLAPIEVAPFYGMEFHPGAFGTAGGIATDAVGQAMREDKTVIDGLYALGNVAAHPLARGYPGAGSTLGPAMTMGYVIGRAIAGETPENAAT